MNSDVKVLKNWKPNIEVRKSIKDIFAKELHKKEAVQKSIQKFKNKDSNNNSTSAKALAKSTTTSSEITLNTVLVFFVSSIEPKISTVLVEQYSYKLKDS